MRNMSALIIDDSEIDRYILHRQLSAAGVTKIYVENDGSSALAFFEDFESKHCSHGDNFPPNVIFLDINMPIVGGFEFLERFAELRSRLALQSCAIIMYSSSDRPEDKQRAESYEFVQDFLTKGTLTTDELISKLEGFGN